MTEPSGYTALDLIGFTDKGTYDATASYVKNDLVHYYGIWRCLVDDTTGITPVEGANWTLFIGEPTSAIEGIIAPIETNPATNSYAVGRQFIYNDALYEVIVAITAGDALVAYEDDPSNANIQLADPVETQLLNFEEKAYAKDDTTETDLASDDLVPFYDTSAAAKRQMTVANMVGQTVSNPNLLDNPWFTVNQRGVSSFGGDTLRHYGPDRWQIPYNPASNTINVTSDGLQIVPTTSQIILWQKWDEKDFKELIGKRITASVMLSDGTIYSGSAIFPQKGDSDSYPIKLTDTGGLFNAYYQYSSNSDNVPAFGIDVKPGKSVTIKAVKLELGTVSTLAMDTGPNYQQELAKCQRYFQRIGKTATGSVEKQVSVNMAHGINDIWFPVFLPVPLRATPSIEKITGTWIVTQSGSGAPITTSPTILIAPTDVEDISEINLQVITPTAETLTIGAPYKLTTKAEAGQALIFLSADL